MNVPLRLFVMLVVLGVASTTSAEDLVVVVHRERTTRLDRETVAQIYLKKRRFWDEGSRIVAINRNAGSKERELFDRLVFGREARWLNDFWNRAYFHGVLPPATLASDEAVRRFVASEPDAIGYLDPAAVDDSVRVVLDLGTTRP